VNLKDEQIFYDEDEFLKKYYNSKRFIKKIT
jgi:hypothetical protein